MAAATHFEEALSLSSQDTGEPVNVYGMRYEPYLPNYFLGVARLGAGDRAGAARAFAEAGRQGAVAKSKFAASFEKQKSQAGPAPTEAAESNPDITPVQAPATDPGRTPEATRASAPPAQPEAPTGAPGQAGLASETRAAGTGGETPRVGLEIEESDLEKSPVRSAALAEPASDTAGLGASAASRIADPGGPTATAISPSGAQAAREPSEALRAAARAFFEGRYEEVLAVRETSLGATPDPGLCVLKSASAFSLARTLRPRSSEYLEQAGRLATSCKRAGAREPTVTHFSPPFVAFYRGVR